MFSDEMKFTSNFCLFFEHVPRIPHGISLSHNTCFYLYYLCF